MLLDTILRNLLAHYITQYLWLRHEPPLKYAQTMYSGTVYKLLQYNGQSLRLSTCDIPTCILLPSDLVPIIRFFVFLVILLMVQVFLVVKG